jgi:WD40 repeat protein
MHAISVQHCATVKSAPACATVMARLYCMQVFSISAGMSIRPTTSVCHSSPVISLASAFQSRRGGWAEDIGCELVSCDDQGIIRVWQAHSSVSYLDAGVSVKAGVPCCSLAVRKGFVIAAGSDGCIRIYHLVSSAGLAAPLHYRARIMQSSQWFHMCADASFGCQPLTLWEV